MDFVMDFCEKFERSPHPSPSNKSFSVFFFSIFPNVHDLSSKVEMNKWIEDLNMAIDMAKKSQEKSDLFLESGLSDRSNSKREITFIF